MNAAQCRAARALLDWTQPRLAGAAGVGMSTVVDFEKARRTVSTDAVSKMALALQTAGIEFTDGGKPGGVRLSLKESLATGFDYE